VAVKFKLAPAHKVKDPLIAALGIFWIVTDMVDVDLHPAAFVTVTVYIPELLVVAPEIMGF
jgi:hypothetical protein